MPLIEGASRSGPIVPTWEGDAKRSIRGLAASGAADLSDGTLVRALAEAGAGALAEDAELAAGGAAAARADEEVARARPSRRYNVPAIRRMSMISGSIAPRLRGCGYVMDLSSRSSARIARLTNLRIDELAALASIAAERARREAEVPAAAGGGGGDDDDAAELAVCLAGFRVYVVENFARLIPIPLSESAYSWLYHDTAVCALTGSCVEIDCANVAKARARAATSAALAAADAAADAVAEAAAASGSTAAEGEEAAAEAGWRQRS